MAAQFSDAMLLQMDRNYEQLMSGTRVGDTASPEAFKREQMLESRQRFLQRFRELYAQRVNLAELVESMAYPLYDKYFTQSELQDLVAFYKSPTGQKAVTVMPTLMKESMQKTTELVLPQIRQVADEVLREEKERLLKLNASKSSGEPAPVTHKAP